MIEWAQPAAALPERESGYSGEFRRGADIFPYVLSIAEQVEAVGGAVEVSTRRSRQEPWSGVNPQRVRVPARWLSPLLRSDHLLPFATAPDGSDRAIIPLDGEGRLLGFEEARREEGWRGLDEIYRELRGGGRNTPRALLDNLDHQGKLRRQLPMAARDANAPVDLVIYPKSGDIMRACRIRTGEALIHTTLYYCRFELADESAYLVALLNAPVLNAAFVQSRQSGRDFHLHPWSRVPIPGFDPENDTHRELADLCAEAEQAMRTALDEAEALPGSQVGRSKFIRRRLRDAGLADRLDAAARRLLPNQCT